MFVSCFVYSLAITGHLCCFLVLAIVNNASTNTGVQISVEYLLSILLGIFPEVELLDNTKGFRKFMESECFLLIPLFHKIFNVPSYYSSPYSFLRNCHVFQRLYHFTFWPAMHKGSHFFTLSAKIVIFNFFV